MQTVQYCTVRAPAGSSTQQSRVTGSGSRYRPCHMGVWRLIVIRRRADSSNQSPTLTRWRKRGNSGWDWQWPGQSKRNSSDAKSPSDDPLRFFSQCRGQQSADCKVQGCVRDRLNASSADATRFDLDGKRHHCWKARHTGSRGLWLQPSFLSGPTMEPSSRFVQTAGDSAGSNLRMARHRFCRCKWISAGR